MRRRPPQKMAVPTSHDGGFSDRQDVAREIPLVRRQFFLRDSLYYIALILV